MHSCAIGDYALVNVLAASREVGQKIAKDIGPRNSNYKDVDMKIRNDTALTF